MAFLSSVAIIAATKLGFKLAEKKKWLPAGLYHQLTLEKLKQGDLQNAVRLNEITLEKKPDHEKAQIVQDLIAMRRDTLLSQILQNIKLEKSAIRDIHEESRRISRRLYRLKTTEYLSKFAPWVFLFVNIFTYLFSYVLIVVYNNQIAGSLLGGFAVVCSLLLFFHFRRFNEVNIQCGLQAQELTSAQKSMAKELVIRNRRLRQLQSQLSRTRYQLGVK